MACLPVLGLAFRPAVAHELAPGAGAEGDARMISRDCAVGALLTRELLAAMIHQPRHVPTCIAVIFLLVMSQHVFSCDHVSAKQPTCFVNTCAIKYGWRSAVFEKLLKVVVYM